MLLPGGKVVIYCSCHHIEEGAVQPLYEAVALWMVEGGSCFLDAKTFANFLVDLGHCAVAPGVKTEETSR